MDDYEDAADHGSKSVAKEGRGEGAKSTTGSEPKSGSQDRGGLCKNLPIANWSPESRVPVVGILAFWFRTPKLSSTTKVLSKGAKVNIISLKRWRKRQVEAEVGSVVHIFTPSEIISTEWIMLAGCVALKRKDEKMA